MKKENKKKMKSQGIDCENVFVICRAVKELYIGYIKILTTLY